MSITLKILTLYERFTERSQPTGVPGLGPEELKGLVTRLTPALNELEILRQSTLRTIEQRVRWMVPGAALAGGLVDWLATRHTGSGSTVTYVGIAVAVAWAIAFTAPQKAYARAYKDKVLPHVAACFGNLSYRRAEVPNLDRLSELCVLPSFNKREVEDEVFGTYRGVAIRIVEARLSVKAKETRVVFNGLLVEFGLSGRATGKTLVVRDVGLLSNALQAARQRREFDRVRLEDPVFEKLFQVYGTDQIAARALLTPAVMERLMALSRSGDVPCLLAENGFVQMPIRRDEREDHFEPPSITGTIDPGEHLARLAADLAFVLSLTDALLELQGMRRPVAQPAPASPAAPPAAPASPWLGTVSRAGDGS